MEPEVVLLREGAQHFADSRGGERWLRVSWHAGGHQLIVSIWRDGACVGTTRLSRTDAADLISALAEGLADSDVPDPASRAS